MKRLKRLVLLVAFGPPLVLVGMIGRRKTGPVDWRGLWATLVAIVNDDERPIPQRRPR